MIVSDLCHIQNKVIFFFNVESNSIGSNFRS